LRISFFPICSGAERVTGFADVCVVDGACAFDAEIKAAAGM
jgi:hypothetical protein